MVWDCAVLRSFWKRPELYQTRPPTSTWASGIKGVSVVPLR